MGGIQKSEQNSQPLFIYNCYLLFKTYCSMFRLRCSSFHHERIQKLNTNKKINWPQILASCLRTMKYKIGTSLDTKLDWMLGHYIKIFKQGTKYHKGDFQIYASQTHLQPDNFLTFSTLLSITFTEMVHILSN